VPASSLADAGRRPGRLLRPLLGGQDLAHSHLVFAGWIALAAFLIGGGVASAQWQGVLTFVLVTAAGVLYLRRPVAALTIVVALWAFSPFLRRVIDYATLKFGTGGVLTLAPFLATAVVGLLATVAVRPPRYLVLAAGAVLAGIVLGVPEGLDSPLSVVFGLFAYGSAVMALFIGYAEERRGRHTLEVLLVLVLPVLAGYGLLQYFGRLPAWDSAWITTSGIKSVGSKQHDNFRIFSMLNSPATFAALLTVFLSSAVVAARLTVARIALSGVAIACLALTNIRTSWLALGISLIIIMLVSRGRAVGRVALLLVLLGGLYLAFAGTRAGHQVVGRANTLSALGEDESLSGRMRQVRVFGPDAAGAPLGHGLGSVGQASRAREGYAPFDDNGLLMLLYQIGPLGFLLVMAPMLGLLIRGLTRVRGPTERARRLPLAAPAIATMVTLLASDALYGITAFMMWYCLGALAARVDMTRGPAPARRAGDAVLGPTPVLAAR
jgi:O-antigen ligase